MDIAIVDHGEGMRLLRNDIRQGNWLELRLHNRVGRGRQPVGFGDGAAAIVYAGGVALRRTVGSASYLSQDSRRLHFGLGSNPKIDKVEVQWPDGAANAYTGLEANAIWDLTEGDSAPRRSEKAGARKAEAPSGAPLAEFWARQRAAMDAMKREKNIPRAAQLFREALELNPSHEDSRYYLANCLLAEGDQTGALVQFDELIRINPQSHRAYQRKGLVLASRAASKSEMRLAEDSVRQALALNSEETGSLLLLGEIALAEGDLRKADQHLEWTARTNPRAAGAFFLRGYLAWKRRDSGRAAEFLKAARSALGPDWKPKGSVAEGDVRVRMNQDDSLFSRFWEDWDGSTDPASAYRSLDADLRARAARQM